MSIFHTGVIKQYSNYIHTDYINLSVRDKNWGGGTQEQSFAMYFRLCNYWHQETFILKFESKINAGLKT